MLPMCIGGRRFRAVATRYDKRDNNMYQATVDAASIRIWLRDTAQSFAVGC
jgi:hypothetical protein